MSRFTMCLCLLVASVILTTNAFGWGSAVHTYVADQLGVTQGHLNYDEMYGAVLTDEFSLILDNKGGFMDDQCHHNFMAFVQQAHTCGQIASAFGMALHNDTWGIDYTAHHNSFTFPGNGYAVVKGLQLAPGIVAVLVPIMMNAGIDEATATAVATGIAPLFGHSLSETAVDLWLRRTIDPAIGGVMVQAATRRSSDVGQLLADTYAASLAGAVNIPLVEAKEFIMTSERAFRDEIIQYGRLFTLPEEQCIGALAMYTAAQSQVYLKALTGVDVTVAPEVAAGFILQAMAIVAADYGSELTQTLAYVDGALQAHGIATCEGPGGSGKLATADNMTTPYLAENYPNPFNPTTTISYALPEVAHVTLRVYNMLGQEIATLVDGVEEPGYKSVQWSATGLASGMYVYSLQAGSYVSVRKMVVMK